VQKEGSSSHFTTLNGTDTIWPARVAFVSSGRSKKMNSSLPLRQPIRTRSLIPLQNHKSARFKLQPSRFVNSSIQNCSRTVSFSPSSIPTQPRFNGSVEFRTVPSLRVRVSSNDAQFGSLNEDCEPKAPSFREFITSERIKVVSMLALALALCNADRVVMSVAIVPLSLAHGWSRSFSGVVQVIFFFVFYFFMYLLKLEFAIPAT